MSAATIMSNLDYANHRGAQPAVSGSPQVSTGSVRIDSPFKAIAPGRAGVS
jgi:hypothetical protein